MRKINHYHNQNKVLTTRGEVFCLPTKNRVVTIKKNTDMKATIKKLEQAVKERKLTARAAEIKLLEKYEIEELEDVLPHRRIEVTEFDNKNLYLENGECVSGEFPRKGKIFDNVEYCQDTQRFEFLEYFMKEEE